MAKMIVLPRDQARHKIRAATRAVYFFCGASQYEREVPVEEVAALFESDPAYRLRIDPEDSTHLLTRPRGMFFQGYRLEF